MISSEMVAMDLMKQRSPKIPQSQPKNQCPLKILKTNSILIEASLLKPFHPQVS